MTEDMNRKRNREGADPQPVNPGDSPLAAAEGSSGEVAAPKRCGRTMQYLDNILKEAEYNASSLAYRAYFFKNGDATGKGVQVIRGTLDSDIDRCKECGLTISEHNPAAAAAPQPLPPAPCAVPTVFVTLTANLTQMCGEERHELLQTCVEALKLSATPENMQKKEAHPFHVLVSSPRQGKSRWLDELVAKINAHPIEVYGVRLVAIPISYNGETPMCEEDWSPTTFAARFFWRVLHSLHGATASLRHEISSVKLNEFVDETATNYKLKRGDWNGVLGLIRRLYELKKIQVVVCADEFSKPYGMLKQRCQKLHTLGPRGRMC